jgi:hypothetical protein
VTVRVAPQLSAAVTTLQVLPSREQNAASVSGVHTQTFEPLHVCGALHEPHVTVRLLPQLSAAVTAPHVLPSREQNAASVSGSHPQT